MSSSRMYVMRVVSVSQHPSSSLSKAPQVPDTDFDGGLRLEAQAVSILESITDAFFALNAEWRFTFANSQAYRILERTPGDLIGRVIWEEYPGLVGSAFEQVYRRTASERVALSVESYYPDHERWYEVHAYPAPDGISVYFRNVTERKMNEEARQRLAEQWRSALDAAQLGTWHMDPVTHELITDKRLREIFGVTRERLDYETAVNIIHPDDRDRVREKIRAATQPDNPHPYSDEHRVVHPDGTIRWIYAIGRSRFAGEGSERRLISLDGTVADITERKKTEDALRIGEERIRAAHSLLEGITEGTQELIVAIDAEFRFIAANTAYQREFKRIFGTDARVGGSLADALAHLPEQQKHAMDLFGRALRGENVVVTAEFGDPNREQRIFDLRFFPIRNAHGEIIGAGEIASDVTERIRMAAKMEEQSAALREADRRKNEFLAMLAHELRNPLASVSTAATLLREDTDTESRMWAANVISRQTAQLARLVDDLLDVSRITRGRIELRKELLDAANALESAIQVASPLIKNRLHTFTTSFEHGTLWLQADPTRLEQIIVNLLTNAAKYTPPSGQIRLEGRREPALSGMEEEVVITVHDNGIGLPPESIEQMFELFAQGERSAARSEGGLGIGLTVVRGICELHGGSVSAHSDGPGTGTLFTVRLPAAPIPEPLLLNTPAPRAPTQGAGVRVLVVDDNVDTATGLYRLLHRRGYEVQLAHNGLGAMTTAHSFEPAIVLLDIGLPGMDGYEVAGRLRSDERYGKIMIVALSGYAEDAPRARAAGFDHHFVKPVDFAALEELMARVRLE